MTTQYTILDARPTSRNLPTERYVLLGNTGHADRPYAAAVELNCAGLTFLINSVLYESLEGATADYETRN